MDTLELSESPHTIFARRHTGLPPHALYATVFSGGDYTNETYAYDYWIPTGMPSILTTLEKLEIKNDAYDDWYLSHRK